MEEEDLGELPSVQGDGGGGHDPHAPWNSSGGWGSSFHEDDLEKSSGGGVEALLSGALAECENPKEDGAGREVFACSQPTRFSLQLLTLTLLTIGYWRESTRISPVTIVHHSWCANHPGILPKGHVDGR